ncbi:MAG: alpha/beta hydrolase [Rhodobacteraceae bacterium]|nr:alpha/beta hydrolase [Paracoccaceae bacterium]
MPDFVVDYLEAGSGPLVILLHSSVSGARQWRKLMDCLSPNFTVRAVNLFGYGKTPPWSDSKPQTLDDQLDLIMTAIPPECEDVCLVGHSFGGVIAMKAALQLGTCVRKLVLFEPNPFFLLRDNKREDAFAEAVKLRDIIKYHGARDDWMSAAEYFADYWGGDGTWEGTSLEHRGIFAKALKSNSHEWEGMMAETLELQTLVSGIHAQTLVMYDPTTVRPIREIVDLLRNSTSWKVETVAQGGHMAPLSRPDLVNPVIERFLLA